MSTQVGETGSTETEISSQRLDDLKDACAMLADDLKEFNDLIEQYVRQIPARRRETPVSDCNRFLNWIEGEISLDKHQRDVIVDQQSRNAVEFVAFKQRIAHLRYQEMLASNQSFEKQSAKHLGQFVYINPVHVWATFETQTFLEDDASIPATVLFYSVEGVVRTAVIDALSEEILRELENGPQKLRTMVKQTPKSEREFLLNAIQRLVELKVLALGS